MKAEIVPLGEVFFLKMFIVVRESAYSNNDERKRTLKETFKKACVYFAWEFPVSGGDLK